MSKSISNEQSNYWSLLLEVFKLIALISAGAFGLWQYSNTASRQFEAPLWEKQIQLYFSASDSAAQIAFRPITDAKWQDSRIQFWTLYNGSLTLVEDRKVEAAMVHFGQVLFDLENFIAVKTRLGASESKQGADVDGHIAETQKKLQTLSLDLSFACRDSLSDRLAMPLPTLDGLKKK